MTARAVARVTAAAGRGRPGRPRPGTLAGRLPLLLLLLLTVACGPSPSGGDTIVLLGGQVFGAGDRPARLLDELARASGALGPSRFRVVGEPGDHPADLLARLETQDDLRAVVAVIGDLALMHEVDPNRAIAPLRSLSSRVVDEAALVQALDDLADHCAARELALVLATPPLGIQGRVELPELLRVAAAVRQLARRRELPLLDLTEAFREREPGPLFEDGLVRLDPFGQDVLAGLVFDELRREPVLPPRDAAETVARRSWDALLAWAAFEEDWDRGVAGLLRAGTATGRAALIQASLSTLQLALSAPSRQRWRTIDGALVGEQLGVLAVGRALCGDAVDPVPGADPLIAHLQRLLAVYHGAPREGLVAGAEALVDARPARLAPWIALETAARIEGQRRGVAREARVHLSTFVAPPLSTARVEQLFSEWPATLTALPAVLLLEDAYRSFRPQGELLQRARRLDRVGRRIPARRYLLKSLRKLRVPGPWQDELDALRQD